MKILHWGTSDKGKPRTRILLAALNSAGADVTEIHHDLWTDIEDKSQLSAGQLALRYARWLAAYPVLLWRFLTAPKPDAVLLGYPAQVDVLVLWPVAKLRGVPILMDLFISLYDTAVVDRGLARPGSLKARLLWAIDWLACRAADRVIIDTAAHARYVEELFDLAPGSVGSVPVGVEEGHFQWQAPAIPGARPQVLFYGQLIPLHGIEVVLSAALSDRGKAFDWVIIGAGQDTAKVRAALGTQTPDHVTWSSWAPYAELKEWIAKSDICLGIFGGSRKAASVIPNKVYQALACGRHVVTRASPAMDELITGGGEGITLVEAESNEALLDGIEAAVRKGCPPPSSVLLNSFSADRIGARLIEYIQALEPESRFQTPDKSS
jgi:glycosyltransferase involved in cell wall biosynthesis